MYMYMYVQLNSYYVAQLASYQLAKGTVCNPLYSARVLIGEN